jgi:hypothetical protein
MLLFLMLYPILSIFFGILGDLGKGFVILKGSAIYQRDGKELCEIIKE